MFSCFNDLRQSSEDIKEIVSKHFQDARTSEWRSPNRQNASGRDKRGRGGKLSDGRSNLHSDANPNDEPLQAGSDALLRP